MARPWHALLLVVMGSACSAPTPPAPEAAEAPSPPGTPSPPQSPAPPTSAPAVAAPAPQAARPAAVTEEPVVDTPPVAPAAAATPARPATVKKPRPLTAVKEPAPRPPGVAAAPVHATVTTLSRGKGVPPQTREALNRIRALLEERKAGASVTALQVQRIGLEGESRLCIEFRSAADAQATLAEMRRIATGSDLLDIAETPCPYRKEPTP